MGKNEAASIGMNLELKVENNSRKTLFEICTMSAI